MNFVLTLLQIAIASFFTGSAVYQFQNTDASPLSISISFGSAVFLILLALYQIAVETRR